VSETLMADAVRSSVVESECRHNVTVNDVTAGLFFRFGAFTTNEAAPFYYAVTMLLQMCGNVAIGVVQGECR
jgi:hypothetical protein